MTWGLHGLALLPVSPQHCHSLGDTKWVPPTEYSFFSMIPPTFRSLHLSWAHHYWALNGGFLETSSRYLTPRPVEPGKFATPLNVCFRVMDNFVVRPRKAVSFESQETLLWLKSLTHTGCKSKVVTRPSPCQRGSCCRSFQKTHLLAQYLPKQNGVFGFCFGVAMLTYVK